MLPVLDKKKKINWKKALDISGYHRVRRYTSISS